MTARHSLRDFLRLNPDEAATVKEVGGQASPRSTAWVRELGTTVGLALVSENHGTPGQRAEAIARRATLAQQRGEALEARLEERFARLNPEFGVLPSRTDPNQHQFAHGRERALALGTRVHLAEARENVADPELSAEPIRQRAEQAARRAVTRQPIQRRATARVGAER